MSNEAVIARLKGKGMSITQPRIMILDYLMTHFTHPAIETIYNDLVEEHPGLSKTTVYNTIQLLAQEGLITKLCIDDSRVNLDGNTMPHAHLLCRCCGRIVDLPLKGITPGKAGKSFSMDGNTIEEVHQYYRGVCKECKENKLNNNF